MIGIDRVAHEIISDALRHSAFTRSATACASFPENTVVGVGRLRYSSRDRASPLLFL